MTDDELDPDTDVWYVAGPSDVHVHTRRDCLSLKNARDDAIRGPMDRREMPNAPLCDHCTGGHFPARQEQNTAFYRAARDWSPDDDAHEA